MGLSAEELNAETLYPGDTIEYFSMAFVSGDPRGHRVAKVLKVLKGEPEYPLRLESQELLPITLMIRRKFDRHDDEIDSAGTTHVDAAFIQTLNDAKWRKIRTFKLVTGEVQGKTRADRLNAGLKQSMASAIQAAKASFASQRAGGASGRGEEESGRSKLEKTTKEKKPKVKAKPERFQQQQLSFVKPVTSFKSTEKGEAKRESLDSMSRRKPSRNDDKTDLKHKKPRLISLSSASAPSSQSVRGTHQSSSSKTERHIEKKQPTPPSSQSKYFASSSSQKAQYKSSNSSSSKTPHKKIPLRQFVDSVEEKKKSSLDMTLDEYLALDKAKKSQEQQLRSDDTGSNRTDKLSTGSSSSNASVSSKWERDRNKFRAKTQTENSSHGISSKWRIDSQSMGRWLTSGKSQQQQPKKSESTQSPPRGRGTSSPADHSHSGRTSLERPRVKFSGLRNGFSASTSAALSSRHQSPITRKDLDFLITPSTPEKRRKYQVRDDDDSDSADEQQKSARKRKRSSDFTSPVKRSTTPYKSSDRRKDRKDVHTPDLMNTWIAKKRD